MAKETLLKKDFAEKDVQRIRNLMTKQYGAATVTQAGYTKKTEDHAEGDIWEENKKMWTIKNGIKQSYTKLDGIKELLRMPLCCPGCGVPMKTALDKKFYPIHKKCFDCVIKYESSLKGSPDYEEYVKKFVNGNIVTHLEEAEQFIDHYINESRDTYVTEAGDTEDWDGTIDKTKMVEQWKKEIQEMKESISI